MPVYSLDRVFEAEHNSTVSKLTETKNIFFVPTTSSFAVLDEGNTVLGVNGTNFQSLVSESLGNRENYSEYFGEREEWIQTLLYHHQTQSLLVGGDDEKIVQYHYGGQPGTWKKLKTYLVNDFDSVTCSSLFSRFGVFGGSYGLMDVIDIANRKLLLANFETGLNHVYCVKVIEGNSLETYLWVGGEYPLKDDSFIDFFEISNLKNISKRVEI